ncbi:ABC transporter permease [Nonomuraea fuscirosea]|jgi:ribose transport system permease protein|uniref:Ribose transport system permease protein n=1 Tax=Nonomuraea fuscirosea TaxID=1291556 RepID=A0A2T0NAU1_9ACTN|nr:ABC transporter permease [Nonomuraea fuscirosea]PRX70131.1 ribose transport system permease protein [Nonomuraea fuscirosea]WSA54489.1 ABC transporter permease [Nonomuraea fuscirosea]
MTATASARAGSGVNVPALVRHYAVLIMLVALFVVLSVSTSSFLTLTNLLNILNQNAPLAIIAVAGTLVVICGGFDLSTGAIFSVANVVAAWVALHLNSPVLGLIAAPLAGAALGLVNGVAITRLRIHSFLATLASSLVYAGLAVLITGGFLISVQATGFTALGRGGIGPVYYAIVILALFALLSGFLLNRTAFGRYVLSVGGNAEAAELSGIRVNRIKLYTFLYSGLAAGIAAAIGVSRIGTGQPQAGDGMQLLAIAAVILGGTSIYGGVGAIWRSVCGVYLLALIDNGFDILNANPFFKDLTTGVVILAAVALSVASKRR